MEKLINYFIVILIILYFKLMLYEKIYQYITQLNSYMKDGIYNDLIHDQIAKIDYLKLDESFSILMEQTKLNDLENLQTSTYVIFNNTLNHKIDCIADNCIKEKDEWKITFQMSDTVLYLDILNLDTLYNWLVKNKANRYLCIPVSLDSEYVNDSDNLLSHACTLIIDN